MTSREHEAWRRAMGEAASLPPDDPQRVAVQAEVSRGGPWAEKEWLALLEEGEQWRLELARVEVPEGLEDRLLRIPQERRPRRLLAFARVSRLAWAAAALLAAGLALWAWTREEPARADPFQTLALLAMNDHLDTHGLDVTSSDPAEVVAALGPRIPFEVRFPDLGGRLTLVGGRRCTLVSHPVAFSTWRRDGVRFTLLQMRREDFGLPADLRPVVVRPSGAAAGAAPLDVRLWTEGGFGYALVADDPAALSAVGPGR